MSKKYFYLSLQQVVDSELLSIERMAELLPAITERFQPLFDKDGNKLNNLTQYYLTEDGKKKYYLVMQHGGAEEYARREVLRDLLTEEECELLNNEWWKASREKREKEEFEKAEKIKAEHWGGWVVWDIDQYFSSVEDFIDWWYSEYELDGVLEEPLPKYVFAAKPVQVIKKLWVDRIVEDDIDNNGWEEMEIKDFKGVDELQKALDKFVEENKSIVAYWPDYTKAIII